MIKIYAYGCLPPVQGLDVIEDQLRRAHRYRNRLCEIERARREAVAAIQAQHDTLGPVIAQITELEAAVEDKIARVRELRSGGREAVEPYRTERLALSEEIRDAKARLKELRAQRRAEKERLRGDEALKALYRAADTTANDARKVARKSDEAPYWGTYLQIEEIADKWRKTMDPPRFERFDGSGKIAVQIQGGLTVAELLSGEDTRIRIMPATARVRRDGTTAPVRDTYRTVAIRGASDEAGRPVWVTLPMVMHRPLPEDAKIKWAWVLRRKEGVRYRYGVQFVVETETMTAAPARSGTVAVDVGSRERDGEVSVCTWLGSDGQRGTFVLPTHRLSSPSSHGKGRRKRVPCDMGKVNDLQGIRDKHLDEVKAAIVGAREGAPEWYRERTKSAHQWRSPGRVGALYRDMMREPTTSGMQVTEAIKAYLDHDRHLLDWQVNERRRHLARRKDAYRALAARLASQYETLVVSDRDYTRAEPSPEEGAPRDGRQTRRELRMAAPGELREALMAAFKARGGRAIKLDVDGDTAHAVALPVCERLLASAAVMPAQADPLAGGEASDLAPMRKLPRRRRLGTAPTVDPLAHEDVAPRSYSG